MVSLSSTKSLRPTQKSGWVVNGIFENKSIYLKIIQLIFAHGSFSCWYRIINILDPDWTNWWWQNDQSLPYRNYIMIIRSAPPWFTMPSLLIAHIQCVHNSLTTCEYTHCLNIHCLIVNITHSPLTHVLSFEMGLWKIGLGSELTHSLEPPGQPLCFSQNKFRKFQTCFNQQASIFWWSPPREEHIGINSFAIACTVVEIRTTLSSNCHCSCCIVPAVRLMKKWRRNDRNWQHTLTRQPCNRN